MGMSKLEQAISELQREVRTTLYLNEKRIKESYDLIGEPDQFTIINQLTRGGEAGILGWFKLQIQNLRGDQALKQISDSPLLMAIMVETHFKISGQVLKLPDEQFRRDARLIEYVGESHIVEGDQDITAETTGLSDALAQVVRQERDKQQDRMKKWTKNDPSMFVWTAAGEPALASIAAWRWVVETDNLDSWASGYHLQHPKGIIGSLEREKRGIVLSVLYGYGIQRIRHNEKERHRVSNTFGRVTVRRKLEGRDQARLLFSTWRGEARLLLLALRAGDGGREPGGGSGDGGLVPAR